MTASSSSSWRVQALALALASCTLGRVGGVRPESLERFVEAGNGAQPRAAVSTPAHSDCVPMTFDGSAPTVTVFIGTQQQGPFHIIADTGSTAFIVQSCFCGQHHQGCNTTAYSKCYQGNNSSTFAMFTQHGWEGAQTMSNPLMRWIEFGSGTIEGIVARDRVCVGSTCATMSDGFVSMTQANLTIGGPTLEGILGLGRPQPRRIGDGYDTRPQTSSFLEQANIQRFSMCFNAFGSGALRVQTEAVPNALGSFGVMHWGLGLEGVSVRGANGAVFQMDGGALCTAMEAGMDTPCGAIPDSGTTFLTMPRNYLITIQAAICDAWPRCVRHFGGGQAGPQVKSLAFLNTLRQCGRWMEEGTFPEELPELHFQLTGKGGGTTDIRLPGSAYAFESARQGQGSATECMAAMQTMAYDTDTNGPIFVLGMPLFHAYKVDYDLSTATPGVAFTQLEGSGHDCSSCSAPSYLETGSGPLKRQRLWRADGPMRKPTIDTSVF